MNVLGLIIAATCFMIASQAVAGDQELTIVKQKKTSVFSVDDLWGTQGCGPLTIVKDPEYNNQEMKFEKACPLSSLLNKDGLDTRNVVTFRGSDNFETPAPAKELYRLSAEPYVAVEGKNVKWPPRPGTDTTMGPFRIVWVNRADRSKPVDPRDVPPEYWAYKLAKIDSTKTLHDLYPGIFPEKKLRAGPIGQGMGVFVRYCFPCHQMNSCGFGAKGPDLKTAIAMLGGEQQLKDDIRDKDGRRAKSNPTDLMPVFGHDSISDSELNKLITYFKHMGQQAEMQNCKPPAGTKKSQARVAN